LDKPSDFFVGVTDVFSIFLPGAAVTYICLQIRPHMLGLRDLGDKNERYLAFFALSYLLGHVVDMIGAMFLDNFYDLTYAHWKRSHPESVKEWLQKSPGRFWEEFVEMKRRFRVSRKSLRTRLEDELLKTAKESLLPSMWAGEGGAYQWCRTWVSLKNPGALSEVERLQANSKFFRAMVIVSVLAGLLSFKYGSPFGARGGVVCLLVAGLSFIRFSDQRWKAVQQTYRFFIALRTEPVATPSDKVSS
jgi:hypothetical protein